MLVMRCIHAYAKKHAYMCTVTIYLPQDILTAQGGELQHLQCLAGSSKLCSLCLRFICSCCWSFCWWFWRLSGFLGCCFWHELVACVCSRYERIACCLQRLQAETLSVNPNPGQATSTSHNTSQQSFSGHSTAQHSTAQHSTAQHSAEQRRNPDP